MCHASQGQEVRSTNQRLCLHCTSQCTDLGPVLRTSLITSEIKWHIQDDIIVLIMIRLIGFFEHTCCVWLVSLDWVIWDNCAFMCWLKRGYVSILETMISSAAIGWWQDGNVMTSYNFKWHPNKNLTNFWTFIRKQPSKQNYINVIIDTWNR